MSNYSKTAEEIELGQYLDRFKTIPPEELLRLVDEMRKFYYSYADPKGVEFFAKERRRQSGIDGLLED